jgi:hypothetical protein
MLLPDAALRERRLALYTRHGSIVYLQVHHLKEDGSIEVRHLFPVVVGLQIHEKRLR